MLKKILVLSVFPAPYRCEVFKLLSKTYELTVYFERNTDSERNEQWFANENVNILDNEANVCSYHRDVKSLKQFDFVLVYDYSTMTAMRLMMQCIRLKVPYAINCDGAFISNNFLKNTIKKFFIKRAALCLASGKSAADYFKKFGANDDKIVYHGFTSLFEKDILKTLPDSERKKSLREARDLPEGMCAIAVGRFIKSKAFDVLISAWSRLPKEYTLLLIGGGSEKQNYENQITSLGLSNVRIYDYMPYNELEKFYQACDVFVLPTLTDVWGLVINEAMANGLPVVTTEKCIAGLELIEDDINGYIVPINDEEALCDGIRKIAENESLRIKMAENNLRKIADYTYENIALSHANALHVWSIEHEHDNS